MGLARDHAHLHPPPPPPSAAATPREKGLAPTHKAGLGRLGRSSLEVAIRLVMQLAVRHQLLHAGEALGAAEG